MTSNDDQLTPPEESREEVHRRARRMFPRDDARLRGKTVRRQVEEYRAVTAKHPTWTVGTIEKHLGISHQDVGRLRLFAQAPGEAQGYLFSGKITPAAIETVLRDPVVREDDKLVVLRKIVQGVIGTGAPKLRELMALIPQVRPHPDLLLRWSSTDLRMSPEELAEELLDIRNDSMLHKQEQAQRAAETRMLTETGFNALGWLDDMAEQIAQVEAMWPVLSANPWVRAKLVKKLAENGERLTRLPQQSGRQATPDEPSHPLMVRGETLS